MQFDSRAHWLQVPTHPTLIRHREGQIYETHFFFFTVSYFYQLWHFQNYHGLLRLVKDVLTQDLLYINISRA